MKLFKSTKGTIVHHSHKDYLLDLDWDLLVDRDDLYEFILDQCQNITPGPSTIGEQTLLPPLGRQPVWAAGVTYFKSKEAREEESKEAGGDDFYNRVYRAKRPELFFKASPHQVVGNGAIIRIRKDSKWNVPEPELALMISSGGKIVGYTAGNDVSSRDIEGENPLYLPQAKCYDGSAALGPGLMVLQTSMPASMDISMQIIRNENQVFEGKTTTKQIKRDLNELVEYLFRESSFPHGVFLMTGTGIVPDTDFSLAIGDQVSIHIEGIGTLTNYVV